MRLVDALAQQAAACKAMGSTMYADLLARAADDAAAGGPVAEVMRGHEDDPGPSALGLRLMGGAHALVLQRRAPALAMHYPSVGGAWHPEHGWEAFRALLAEQGEEIRPWLDAPPQTNEVGRAAALIGGLLHLRSTLPVRLVELGSSAGLNLLADRFLLRAPGLEQGPADSPVVLDDVWQGGPPPRPLRFVDPVGCDPAPVDATSTDGRLRLTAYVWADQTARLERLRGALALAARTPPVVRRSTARDLVRDLSLRTGVVNVLWHSVAWQYLDADEQYEVDEAADRLAAEATEEAPFARLRMEPMRPAPGEPHDFLVVLEEHPAGERRVLGRAHPHGLPVIWA